MVDGRTKCLLAFQKQKQKVQNFGEILNEGRRQLQFNFDDNFNSDSPLFSENLDVRKIKILASLESGMEEYFSGFRRVYSFR